jgi:hypothetical protein
MKRIFGSLTLYAPRRDEQRSISALPLSAHLRFCSFPLTGIEFSQSPAMKGKERNGEMRQGHAKNWVLSSANLLFCA